MNILAFQKVIGQLIRVNPRERPNSTSLLEMPEVARRRDSEWFNKLPSHQVVGDVAMLKTIQVLHYEDLVLAD
jgi:hypothetical protein